MGCGLANTHIYIKKEIKSDCELYSLCYLLQKRTDKKKEREHKQKTNRGKGNSKQ